MALRSSLRSWWPVLVVPGLLFAVLSCGKLVYCNYQDWQTQTAYVEGLDPHFRSLWATHPASCTEAVNRLQTWDAEKVLQLVRNQHSIWTHAGAMRIGLAGWLVAYSHRCTDAATVSAVVAEYRQVLSYDQLSAGSWSSLWSYLPYCGEVGESRECVSVRDVVLGAERELLDLSTLRMAMKVFSPTPSQSQPQVPRILVLQV